MLWTERESDRARHALTQAMYSLRRSTGEDNLLLQSADVRLNPAVIATDTDEFERALAAGRLKDAVELYHGPFLDGFHVAAAAEFDWWLDGERTRFARLCASALDTLAKEAVASGATQTAIAWRRRLAALDPLDSARALELANLLVASGDAGGALRHLRAHAARMREELELEMPSAMRALAERLEVQLATPAGAVPAPAAGRTSSERAAAASALEQVSRPDARVGMTPSFDVRGPLSASRGIFGPGRSGEHAPVTHRFGGMFVRLWPLSVLVTAALVVGLARPWRTQAAGTRADPPVDDRIAISEFRVLSRDSALFALAERIPEILAPLLTEDGGPHTHVLAAPRAARGTRGANASDADMTIGSVEERARRASASELVVGQIEGTANHVVIRATSTPIGTAHQERPVISVQGSLADLALILDTLAVKLRAGRMLAPEQIVRLGSVAPDAVRAYLVGLVEYRAARYEEAMTHFERSVHHDSTFGLAGLGLALSADQLNSAEQHSRGLAIAMGSRATLSAADRAHLEALVGPRYPQPATKTEQLGAWERAVIFAPTRPEVWQEMGERFFNYGDLYGITNAEERAAAAFRRALSLQADFAPAIEFLVQLAARQGDTATLRRMRVPAQLHDSIGDVAEYLRWRIAMALGDVKALHRLQLAMPRMSSASLRFIAMASQFDALPLGDAERALSILSSRALLETQRTDMLLAQHSLWMNEGQTARARTVSASFEDAAPDMRAHVRLAVLDALYSDGDPAAAVDAAEQLKSSLRVSRRAPPLARAVSIADLCVLGQWRLARGDTTGVPPIIARLRHSPILPVRVTVGAAPAACAELLDAMLAVAQRRPDARTQVDELASIVFTGPSIGDARIYSTLVLSRLYDKLGEPRLALAALKRRPYMRGWPRYLSTVLLEEGRLAAQVEDWQGAAVSFRRFLALRRNSSSTNLAALTQVRAELSRTEERIHF